MAAAYNDVVLCGLAVMRLPSLVLGLCIVAAPAAAQRIDAPAAADRGPGRAEWWDRATGDLAAPNLSPWRGGMFVGPRSGQGFSIARAGAPDPGLRASPGVLDTLPLSPRLLLPGGAAPPVDGGAYVGYRYSNWTFSSAIRQSLDDPRLAATRIDFGASYGVSLAERHSLTLSGGLTLGQSGATAPAYGTLGTDALSPRTLRYGDPGAGFRVSWLYTLDRNLYVNTTLGYDRLYGDPGEGLGSDRGTTRFGTVFGYRFY
jgi:hypothetical protein